jgi:NTE family protein
MLFHLGALWRLNEAGLLSKLGRVSSVSGGSITAGVLALKWSSLRFDEAGVGRGFADEVVSPIQALAGHTLDVGAVAKVFLPGSVADRLIGSYRKHLFGNATLQALPDTPRFVINATNLQSGALWRFMKPYMRDYKVGEVKNPDVPLATAIAASSAFPPFLSPVRLSLRENDYSPGDEPLHRPPFSTKPLLTDGGVYDNLGLETVWKRCRTVFVSDGGAQMQHRGTQETDWARQALRAQSIVDNQVRALRKRQLIDSYDNGLRFGTYWGIATDQASYGNGVRLACPVEKTRALAETATRLGKLGVRHQQQLINWGYAVSDAALRRYFNPDLPDPAGFPYPGGVD